MTYYTATGGGIIKDPFDCCNDVYVPDSLPTRGIALVNSGGYQYAVLGDHNSIRLLSTDAKISLSINITGVQGCSAIALDEVCGPILRFVVASLSTSPQLL